MGRISRYEGLVRSDKKPRKTGLEAQKDKKAQLDRKRARIACDSQPVNGPIAIASALVNFTEQGLRSLGWREAGDKPSTAPEGEQPLQLPTTSDDRLRALHPLCKPADEIDAPHMAAMIGAHVASMRRKVDSLTMRARGRHNQRELMLLHHDLERLEVYANKLAAFAVASEGKGAA
ncbi:MAG: hypothetical protein L6Q71_04960 [Planctomycetes bacterium]|nr:hypothetical protein [Planctomycetota bacterium]